MAIYALPSPGFVELANPDAVAREMRGGWRYHMSVAYGASIRYHKSIKAPLLFE
jgi:hypothetical protein